MIINATRGDIWLVGLDPVVGHEEAKQRPCLVLSNDHFNGSPAGLAIIIPITSTQRPMLLHIAIHLPEGGLDEDSFLMCEQIRCVSVERFSRYLGKINNDTIHNVEHALKTLLGLK